MAVLRDGIACHPDLGHAFRFNDGLGVTKAEGEADIPRLEAMA